MSLTIPELALVVLIGASGSGKSTFARQHFRPTEVLSSDVCRGLVADDENDQSATGPAFEVLHFIAARRLAAGRLTVVDATNVQPDARKSLLALAREHYCLPVAIVFNLPERLCLARNRGRPDRAFGPHVVRRQAQALRRSLGALRREGFRYVTVLDTPEAVEALTVVREPLWNDRRQEHGPFDVIGDIHGCHDELVALLEELGYEQDEAVDGAARSAPRGAGCGSGGPVGEAEDPAAGSPDTADAIAGAPDGTPTWRHPEGRRVVFVGDLVDRGPAIPAVLRLAMSMVRAGTALCVPGNHEVKLLRKLRGRDVQITHGLAESLAQLAAEPAEFQSQVATFLDGLVSHYVLDDGSLVVAHAGLKEAMQGRGAGPVREFALYGETTGETDEYGLPVRYNWAAEYRGRALVVYGHTPVPEPEWLNNTINVDTGCVFGGRLTALRYPERELVSVPAAHTYYEPARPFLAVEQQAPARTAQQVHDELLDLDDVLGRRIVTTRLHRGVAIRPENAIAALEVMSRFAVDPRWLIYLPPTMSPSATTQAPGLLEHPAEAFAYYRAEGVPTAICQEKHMGSRAVVVVCRAGAARRSFGLAEDARGVCYTRTGRRFFDDEAVEREFLDRLAAALDASGLWAELQTDWVCLDCELMPWSAKAQGLLREQYAAVGAAARTALGASVASLEQAAAGGAEVDGLLDRYRQRRELAGRYVAAYRRYCWPVRSVADLKLAPFHLLASERATHLHRDHAWHLDLLGRLCRADAALLRATPARLVDLTDPASEAAATEWWEELTEGGGEGMVVKPLEFVARGRRGLVQPAVKCRGREYLRIIYRPEYAVPEHLQRLRARGLAGKRSLALREFALGVEALERFTRGEPLRRVHECVFGVLALESEPVDPRL